MKTGGKNAKKKKNTVPERKKKACNSEILQK